MLVHVANETLFDSQIVDDSGSRRVFGTVVEKNVIVLIDTSGSMQSSMEELKRELASLVWEQLHKHGRRCAAAGARLYLHSHGSF